MSGQGRRVLCIAFVDVGQGDATIILPPEGEGAAIVFDCGADGWEVVQQLKTWKIEQIDAVIASHLDADHIGGMLTVLDAFPGRIRAVYFPRDRDVGDGHDDAKKAKQLADHVRVGDESRAWEAIPFVGRDPRPISHGTDWSVDVVAPRGHVALGSARSGHWDEPNRYSAVVRVTMAGKVVLIGADAPLRTWSELDRDELRSEGFRIPHHGGAIDDGGVPDGWTAERLYDEIAPRWAVVSVGTNNQYHHPVVDPWVKPLVGRPRCRMICTQVTGRCHESFDKTGVSGDAFATAIEATRQHWLPAEHNGSSHFAEPPWRHYQQRSSAAPVQRSKRLEVPCAGTVSVRLDDRGDVRVDPSEESPSFVNRVDGWSRPLCRPRTRRESDDP